MPPPLPIADPSCIDAPPGAGPSRTSGLPPRFAEHLIDWQRRSGRHDLPWQHSRDPYRVWLSEVMLQQTQVSTVLAYYGRFLERFPDVQALAFAPLDEVLALWAGLGYYSRARNLHRCAQAVVEFHGGRFPPSSEALAQLPGIGPSTAAAIAVFSFGERAAILDGNVKRVLSRVLACDEDLDRPVHLRALWDQARRLLPADGVEAYTQGLMDLGSSLCSPRSPRCGDCPVAGDCAAFRLGRPTDFPARRRARARGSRDGWWLWVEGPDGLWLTQRPPTGVWSGLWTLPLYPDEASWRCAVEALDVDVEPLAPIAHALTHFDWRLHAGRAVEDRTDAQLLSAIGAGRRVARSELDGFALPAPLRRLLADGSGPSAAR